VAVLELERGRLHTYDSAGRPQQVSPLPADIGRPRLNRGQDGRIYVEGDRGRHVMVVDDAGRSATVTLAGAGAPGPAGSSGATGSPDAPDAPDPTATPPTATRPTATSPTGRPPTSDTSRSPGSSTGSGPDLSRPTTPPPLAPPAGEDGMSPVNPGPGAVPAGPPSMPPRLAFTRSADTLTLTWGAAASNGAAISAYHVAWQTAGSRGDSAVRPGDARSTRLTGLIRGATYRITVTAENSAGRGTAATIDATVLPPRSITVSRGATTTHEPDCLPPGCAFILIEMRGFEPNTAYDIDPWASRWGGGWNPGARLTTDNEGNLTVDDRFPIDGNGQDIWVVVDGMESNRYPWPAREPS